MGVIPPKTKLRLAQQAAVKHYSAGIREFSGVFASFDKAKSAGSVPVLNPEKLEDDLASWLEGTHLADGTFENAGGCGSRHANAKVNYEHIILYRCSWCGNPSAALRKCKLFPLHLSIARLTLIPTLGITGSGCAKTRLVDLSCIQTGLSDLFCRYCDSGCQKQH